MTTYGSDFAGWQDLTPRMDVLEGDTAELVALSQALARRLTTPRGGLFYAPNYGFDIRSLVGDTWDPSQASAMVEAECRKDERVATVRCAIVVSGPPSSQLWQIAITGTAKTGAPFRLVLGVSSVTVDLMKAG